MNYSMTLNRIKPHCRTDRVERRFRARPLKDCVSPKDAGIFIADWCIGLTDPD